MMNPKKVLVVSRLKEIWDDLDFVLGVSNFLKTEDDCQIMLDYLDSIDEHDTSDIVLVGLNIRRLRTEEITKDEFYSWMNDVDY